MEQAGVDHYGRQDGKMGDVIIYGGDGRMISTTSNQYTGSKNGKDLMHWKTFTDDPNDFVRLTYGDLANKNATLFHTSAEARACVKKPLTYSIGDGLVFKSEINAGFIGLKPETAKEWSRTFSELLHYEKIAASYYKKQRLLVADAKITGDSVLYFLRDEEDLKPFDLIPAGGHEIDWESSNKNTILGIKVDDYNRRQGIVRSKTGKELPFKDTDGNQNVIQLLYQERAGQLRGYGCYYSEIARAKGFDRFMDAIINRAVIEATQIGYVADSDRRVSEQARRMVKNASGAPSSFSKVGGGDPVLDGMFYELSSSGSMEFLESKTPSNNFDVFNEWELNRFAMATGYPPEFILGKYPTSFTAHKGALNDAVKAYMQDRRIFIDIVDNIVNLEYLKHFARTGQIDVTPAFWTDHKIQIAYLQGTHLGPVPGHINPLQEVNADIKAIDAGGMTLDDFTRKHGHDFWNGLDEWSAQAQAFAKAQPITQEQKLAQDMENRDANGELQQSADKKEGFFSRRRRKNDAKNNKA